MQRCNNKVTTERRHNAHIISKCCDDAFIRQVKKSQEGLSLANSEKRKGWL